MRGQCLKQIYISNLKSFFYPIMSSILKAILLNAFQLHRFHLREYLFSVHIIIIHKYNIHPYVRSFLISEFRCECHYIHHPIDHLPHESASHLPRSLGRRGQARGRGGRSGLPVPAIFLLSRGQLHGRRHHRTDQFWPTGSLVAVTYIRTFIDLRNTFIVTFI